MLVCIMDIDTGALDKTWSEIKAAYDAGQVVMLYMEDGTIAYLFALIPSFLGRPYRANFCSFQEPYGFGCNNANDYPVFVDE